MHRWFLLLLIALLPLRGWIGDAMAGEMLAQHPVRAQAEVSGGEKATAPVHKADHQPHHDCLEHAQAAAGGLAQAEDVSACAACASCQICSTVALAWSAEDSPVANSTAARPGSASPRFASADPARDLRPPIA